MAHIASDVFKEARFVKSTRSASGGGGCVEVATAHGLIGVRDSKDQTGPVLVFTQDEWAAFVGGVRDGEFD